MKPSLVWCKKYIEKSNDNRVENEIGFDRYESYGAYDGKGKSENPKIEYAGSSPILRSSRDNLNE